jgi:uncharacterized glyoxalase superfamily protein PhnB
MLTNRSAPTASIVPVLVYADADAAFRWLCDVCGFTERLRITGPNGEVTHAQLTFGDGSVMLGRAVVHGRLAPPAPGPISSATLVTVSNVDEHHARTSASGAQIMSAPETMPFGERQYTVMDPGGHWWTFSQHVADVAPEEWGAVVAGRP